MFCEPFYILYFIFYILHFRKSYLFFLNQPAMTRLLTAAFVLCFPLLLNAQSLTEGATLLFKNSKSNLTTAEKNKLFIDLQFHLSKDRKQFIADGDENKEYPFGAQVLPTDFNKDGKEEVFIVYGNSYTSGGAGSSVVVFIKNAAGKYEPQLGFPGMAPDVLATTNKGYPELLIGGPGFEFPVWKWNGTSYVYGRKVKDSEYEKLKKTSLEEVSKAYQATIK